MNRGRGRGRGQAPGRNGVDGAAQAMGRVSLGGGGGRGNGGRRAMEDRVIRGADDILRTKPDNGVTKKGAPSKTDIEVLVVANYFNVKTRNKDHKFQQYRLDFKAADDLYNQTGRKRYLLSQHKERLPKYLFAGDSIFTCSKVQGMDSENKLVLTSHYDNGDAQCPAEITIRYIKDVEKNEISCLQILNHINSEHLRSMRLNQVGSSFFDVTMKVEFKNHNLEVWPGFCSTIRNMENSLMMALELTNKVVRLDTAYDTFRQLRGNQIESKKALIGAVVVTSYNNDKTYRIDDISFDKTAETEFFEHPKHGKVNLIDYFRRQYSITIRDVKQPLLVSMPKKKDIRRGQSDKPILLIPELCRMTGLTDALRSNYHAMQDMAKCLLMRPEPKLEKTTQFGKNYIEHDKTSKILTDWGLEVTPTPVEFKTRAMGPEKIFIGGRNREATYYRSNADWTQHIKNGMLTPACLSKWVVVYASRQAQNTKEFLQQLDRVAPNLRLQCDRPLLVEMPDDRAQTYQRFLRDVAEKRPQMVMVIMFKPDDNIYKVVKTELMVRAGIPSQVVTCQKGLKRDNKTNQIKLANVTKIAIQLGCKIGATPWRVSAPLPKTMMVGFDTFHNKKGNKKSIGALCASYDPYWTQYYCTSAMHEEHNELSASMDSMLKEGLIHYHKVNKEYPSRIFFYRDGVGEGQLHHIKDIEVQKIVDCLKELEAPAKLTFTVVSKRITPRFFLKTPNGEEKFGNPYAGTVIDDIVTLPERHDYYLVSQSVNKGTVNPTSYNIIHDDNKLPAERNQMLAYKLCHVYQNWPGTVRVPAPCQLAHKLAYLIGENELGDPHVNLKGTHFCL